MQIEEVILTRADERGMNRLKKYLAEDFCWRTAIAIAGVLEKQLHPVALIVTGFYVNGAPETDGPPGAFFLYNALKVIGFDVKILTDVYGAPLFEGWVPSGDLREVPVLIPDEEKFNREIFSAYSPKLLCAVERCGRTRDGRYLNMRGEDISHFTSPIDTLFIDCPKECLAVGIGDGGNEIGMGNLKDAIAEELQIDPCVVPVNHLVVTTVSNWGAYGLIRGLEILTGHDLLPVPGQVTDWIAECVRRGAVDGISGDRSLKVDGFDLDQELSILKVLKECGPYN